VTAAEASSYCPLEDHELAILRLVSRGATDPQIAKATSRPAYTITSIVGRVMKRTDCVSRTHLVATALRNGWIA
jgi:DNA-binding NarL/FixJ family response regulator